MWQSKYQQRLNVLHIICNYVHFDISDVVINKKKGKLPSPAGDPQKESIPASKKMGKKKGLRTFFFHSIPDKNTKFTFTFLLNNEVSALSAKFRQP